MPVVTRIKKSVRDELCWSRSVVHDREALPKTTATFEIEKMGNVTCETNMYVQQNRTERQTHRQTKVEGVQTGRKKDRIEVYR